MSLPVSKEIAEHAAQMINTLLDALKQPEDKESNEVKNLRKHRIISNHSSIKTKTPSKNAECVEKCSIFHRKGALNQTVRDFLAARYRFANANMIFSLAVCFRRPRYRVFRYRKIFFMTAKTCSTLQRTDDF